MLTLPNEGKLEGVTRKDGGLLYHAVREGFVNCLTYCDYKLGGVLRIDRKTDKIIMRNPGTLRISPERIYEGDYTQARNSTIQKMLRMIGLGDNIGSGFQKILSAWHSLGYLRPKIQEIPDVNEVWLTLPLYADQKTDQKTDQKNLIIRLISENPHITRSQLSKLLDIHESGVKRRLDNLVKDGKIKRVGPDKGGKWIILG